MSVYLSDDICDLGKEVTKSCFLLHFNVLAKVHTVTVHECDSKVQHMLDT